MIFIFFVFVIFLMLFLSWVFSCYQEQNCKRCDVFKSRLKEGQIYKVYTSELNAFICWYIVVINKIQKDAVIYTIYKPACEYEETPVARGYILNEEQYDNMINDLVRKDNIYESSICVLWNDFFKGYSYDLIKTINNH